MLNIYTVTKALYEQIKNYSAIVKGGYLVEHEDYINMDSDRTPWVGVYKGPIKYDPNCLGRSTQSWKATIPLVVFVQASHGGDAEKCSELLAEYENNVLDAIWADPTIGGTVDMIVGLETTYSYKTGESETMYFQQSAITITIEVNAG